MIPGRYILQPEVMRVLERQEKGAGGEIQLTDAMAQLIGRQPFHGFTFDGQRHDCGDKAGFIQANIALALARPTSRLRSGRSSRDCNSAAAGFQAASRSSAIASARLVPSRIRAVSSRTTIIARRIAHVASSSQSLQG